MSTTFTQLNRDWNAEPNAPDPQILVEHGDLILVFVADSQQFHRFSGDQRIRLRFRAVVRYRLGATNDEGWYRGQCRFSRLAPEWGEFYEVTGDLKLDQCPGKWVVLRESPAEKSRHFLFYLRDQTFECSAQDWTLEI